MPSSASPSSGVQSKLMKDEYQNWLAVGHAFCLMNEGIRPYITREMQTLYNTLLALPHCICIHDNTRKKNPWHDMTTCAWAKVLQGLHHANKPKWSQSDSSKWADPTLGCWEIAKLFMSDLGRHKAAVVDAQSTDVTGLMNILCWCKHFNTLRTHAEQVRNNRNTKWGHVPNLEISLADKKCVIESVINLLNASVLSKDADAQNALQQVKDINIHFDAQELERKILLDFISETETVLDDVMMRLSQCEGRSSKDRKEMEGLEKRLASYEEILIRSNQRIQDMKTSWLYPLWLKAVNVFLGLRKCSTTCLMVLILFVAVVQLDPNTYDDRCPAEDRPLQFDVMEFNFSRQLNSARKGFVGRKWLFEDVKSKLNGSDTSTVLIVGDPGSGKSAIAAHLICSRNSELSINQHIIAYHLCQHYNKETQEPGRFIRNIVDMIARRLPDYENIILNKSLTERLRRHDCEGYPHECFEEGIILPLKDVLKTKQPDTHGDNLYYIVIDALDECIPAQGGPVTTIVDLIKDKAPRFPKNIKLIATTRNDSSFIAELKTFAEIVTIEPSDPRNEKDIAFYIDSAPSRRLKYIDKIIEYFHFRSEEIRMKESQYLVRMGQGNFLFVKLLAQYRRFDPDYTTTPKTIGQVYEEYFRRSYPTTESFRSVRGVLEILVSSLQPLKKEDMFHILSLQNSNLVYKYFLQDLNSLSHFIRYGENSTASLFHKSLAEWLTSEENQGRFFIQKKEGHRKLIPYYIELIKNSDISTTGVSKLIFDFAQHIASGDVYHQYVEVFHNLSSVIIKKSLADDTSLFHLAATINNTIVIELFLPYFQNDLDCVDSRGFTSAFKSASRGYLNNVRFLVNRGANVNHKTNPPPPLPFRSFEDPVVVCKREFWHSTMLHAAAQLGYLDIVEFLVKNKATISDKNGVSMTALQLAAENGHLKIVQLLYNHGAMVDQLALHHAAMNGHKHVVEFLLSKGVTDDCMRCDGSFYWLEGNNRYQSLWIDVGKERPLPDRKFDVDVESIQVTVKDAPYELFDDESFLYCKTALHAAITGRHWEVTRALLSHNALSVTCTDYTGRSPLHLAAAKNDQEIMRLLLDVDVRTTPKCSFVQQMRQLTNQEDSNYIFKQYKHLSIREESDYFTDVCSCDHTPIDVAAAFGHVESAELLLQYNGSLATKRDCNGASIIHIAACNGHHHFVRWIIQYIRDIDINSPSENGSTPLHSAAYCGKHEEVKLLISDGANTRAIDKNNMTALHYAMLDMTNSCEMNISGFECDLDYSEYELYFTNGEVTVWRSRRMMHFLFTYRENMTNTRCPLHEFVEINKHCRTVEELLGTFHGHFDLNAKDSKGRTALEIAVANGFQCSSVVLIKHIPYGRHYNLQANAIWKIAFSEMSSQKQVCNKYRVLLIVTCFFTNFFTGTKCYGDGKNCSTLNNVLLAYLQNTMRSNVIEAWLLDLDFKVNITCNVPFMESELHLISFSRPANDSDNLFFTKECTNHLALNNTEVMCYNTPGSLTKAILHHPLGIRLLNQCRDIEGYTPLHRAAQGGNIVGIKHFLHLGADATATTVNWNQTALEIAVSYAGLMNTLNSIDIDSELASNTSILLLENSPDVKIICDGNATNLTIYHIAAYRGMVRFVKTLLEKSKQFGLNIDCPDANGITPLYLAKLRDPLPNNSKENPWREIVELIESRGGKLSFPLSLEAEHHVLYRHMYKNVTNKMNKYIYEYMAMQYKDIGSVNSCLQNISNQESFDNVLQQASDLLISEVNHLTHEQSKPLPLSVLNDYYHIMKNLEMKMGKVSNEDNSYDFEIQEENQELLKEMTDIDTLLAKILQAKERNNGKMKQAISTLFQSFSRQKLIFEAFDIFVGQIQDILTRIQRFKCDMKKLKRLEEAINRYHQNKLCVRLPWIVNTTFLLFKLHLVEVSFSSMQVHTSDFLQSRLSLTTIPATGQNKDTDFKTLVRDMPYILDLALDRITKYDYLKVLTLGRTPGTQVFYGNGKFDDIEKLKDSIAEVKNSVDRQRKVVNQERKKKYLMHDENND